MGLDTRFIEPDIVLVEITLTMIVIVVLTARRGGLDVWPTSPPSPRHKEHEEN